MRKINKNCDLSTVYKTWEEALEATGNPHPKYANSTIRKEFYWDIVMQLHRCQGGLCAYTEQELCDEPLFATDKWIDGKYSENPGYEGRFGDLEHFDESKKSKKEDTTGRQDWLWDNFFVVDAAINRRKATKPIDNILKPDLSNYDPFEKLEYDFELHVFRPNSDLSEIDFERVEKMIDILGINHVYSIRKKFLKRKFKLKYLGDLIEEEIEQFPTSFEMAMKKIESQELELADLI